MTDSYIELEKRCIAAEYNFGVEVDHTRKLEKENNLWRVLLWIRHGCESSNLYGDDGEMQCNKCMIDFKRNSPESILEKWHNEGLKQFKKSKILKED